MELFPRLADRRSQHAGTLGGGEQQMLAIGRALMAEPKLLMLDEPSLGWAPLLVQHMFELVKSINERGTSILLVEQNVVASLGVADRGYILEKSSHHRDGYSRSPLGGWPGQGGLPRRALRTDDRATIHRT